MAARVFVEELRLRKFGIGSREDSPVAHKFHETIRNLSEGFHEAIRNLSENLYQKDIHFLLEILQNVEDNSYPKWVSPSLEIILTDKDVTETGASGTLLFFNNEVGFSEKNIEALCSIGRSTKKGNKAEGYIGEKGIGFKSVFLVSGRPHIISNGFRIRFHDEPDNEAGLGYVVPEWTEKPTDEDLALLYGSRRVPSTVVVLPLRDGKLENVAKQLAQISPESLLFLSKLSKLCIRDDLQPKSTALSRTVEAADAHTGNPKSFTTVLSVESCGRARETSYYMSIQKFSVPDSSKIASRFGVDEWTITLAFPFEDGVLPSQIGRTYGNVFSFLPTEVQSQFPFLINADFILTSSREAIVCENVWNQGILNLIPEAFCDAFENLLKIDAFGGQSTIGTAPLYRYIPASRVCPSPSLEKVRLEILKNLKWKEIVLCDSEFLDENNIHFCRASDARTVIRTFRDILKQAISNNIQSPLVGGRLKFVNQFVQEHQTSALSALDVQPMVVTEYIDLMPPWWIQSLPDELYAKLLFFIAFDLHICNRNNMACKSFKFLKYKDHSTEEIKYASILDRKSAANEPICLSSGDQKSSWLSIWADVLSPWITFHVMAKRVLFVLNYQSYSRLIDWLTHNLNVISITPESFAEKLISVAVQNRSPKLALICMHFFFDMEQKGLPNASLKGKIPLLDCLGSLQSPTSYEKIFLPPSLSQWPLLMKPETWADVVTKLSDQYLEEQCTMVDLSSVDKKKSFRSFLERKLDAIDVLQLHPLNQSFPTEGLARKEGAMLFLEWIKNVLKNQGYLPREFSKSVASNSCWVRTDHGPRSPTQSFLLVEEIQKFFIGGDLPFIDTEYYGRLSHRHEWEAIGVHTDPSTEECYVAAVEHFQFLMTSPASEMSADKATRFYTYFSSFKCQNLKNLLPTIWIPRTGASSSPSWAAAEKCLISDEDALFETKYSILGTLYNSKRITSFFHNMLGVPLKPGFEHFSELWLDWTKEARNINDWECLKTWTVLAAEKNVKFREGPIWSKFLNEASVPSTLMGNKETITLLHPSKTLVPDDLEMEHLFQASSCPPPMAWYPRSQVCKLSTLFSIYNSMGAQNLSECVKTETDMSSISTSKDIFSDSLWPIQPLVSPELFKLVMGVVSKELSEHERKKVLLPLLTAKEMAMNEGLKLTHSLCLGEQTFTTSSEVLVFWLGSSNIIYHVERCQLKDAVSRLRFNLQLCKAISHGLLSERREMAEDLQQRLSIATLCDLDSSVVDFMLRNMNIPVSEDDMSFIQSKTLEDVLSIKLEEDSASSIPLETLRKRCNGSDEDEVAVSKTVEKLHIGSSSTSLEPLVTQLNISDRPVTPALITSMMGGIGLVKQQKGSDGIPSRTGSNSGNGTNMLEKEKFPLELLHEVRSALLGEGNKILIEIDVSVEPALGWYKAQLLSVRHFLGYPPEPGSLKRGMRVMDLQGDTFDLDKYLFLAFAHPMVSSNVQFGTIHERFITLGHACLNMWITYELLNKHPEKNTRAIVAKRDKMMSRVFCSEFLRTSHLNMCIVGTDSCDDPKILSDVFMAIMGVGYLCYECGFDEVRRLYLEVFVESLEAACEATH